MIAYALSKWEALFAISCRGGEWRRIEGQKETEGKAYFIMSNFYYG